MDADADADVRRAAVPRWRGALASPKGVGLDLFGTALLIAVVARVAYALSVRGVVMVWFPSGVLLALLLLTTRDRWPSLLVGALLGNAAVDLFTVPSTAVILFGALVNVLESFVAAAVIRRLVGTRGVITSLAGIGALLIGAAMLSNAATAVLGGAVLTSGFSAPGFGAQWFRWWVGDGLGMIVMAPAILALASGLRRLRRGAVRRGRLIEGVLLFAAAMTVAMIVLERSTGQGHLLAVLYLLFPLFIWMGIRLGPGLPAAAIALLAGALLLYAGVGQGPFADPTISVDAEAANVYAFLLLMSVSVLVPTAAIAERQLSAELVRVSEARHRAVVETAHDGIMTVDAEGRIHFANPAVEKILGRAPLSLHGVAITDLLVESERDRFRAACAGRFEGTRDEMPAVLLIAMAHQRGRVVPVEVAFGSWEGEGQPFLTLILRDDSERQRLEADLRQAQKMEALGAVTGQLAHEYRNELMVMQGNLELVIGETGATGKLREALDEIGDAIARGTRLTSELLQFGRREGVDVGLVDLDALVERSVRTARPLLSAAIRLDFERSAARKRVRTDESALQQALLNLILNARDAMPAGGSLRVQVGSSVIDEELRRRLSLPRDGPHATIDVIDSGSGMDAPTLERIFEPYFTTKGTGTGLGLAAVYSTIRRSGGAVRAESAVGSGTSFHIFLPLAEL